jgi:hypothetical protein
MMHFYVYSWRDWQVGRRCGAYVFERTCGTENAAREWVKRYGSRSVYTVDHVIQGAFY